MSKLLVVGVLFVLAGLCEIGGYLVWGWMLDHKPVVWALGGAVMPALSGVVAALQPIPEFGRVYAASGGVFMALALAWGVCDDGFRPDRYDLLVAAICVAGVLVMVLPEATSLLLIAESRLLIALRPPAAMIAPCWRARDPHQRRPTSR